jgi:hypothetical protein
MIACAVSIYYYNVIHYSDTGGILQYKLYLCFNKSLTTRSLSLAIDHSSLSNQNSPPASQYTNTQNPPLARHWPATGTVSSMIG